MPSTTTRNAVLCQKYRALCRPERPRPTITRARNTSPTMLVHGEPGIGNVLAWITPRSVRSRSRSWQAKVVPQVKTTPMAAASKAISNASGAKAFEHGAEHVDDRSHDDAGPGHTGLAHLQGEARGLLGHPQAAQHPPGGIQAGVQAGHGGDDEDRRRTRRTSGGAAPARRARASGRTR